MRTTALQRIASSNRQGSSSYSIQRIDKIDIPTDSSNNGTTLVKSFFKRSQDSLNILAASSDNSNNSHTDTNVWSVQTAYRAFGSEYPTPPQIMGERAWSPVSDTMKNNGHAVLDSGPSLDFNGSVPEGFHPSSYERGFHASATTGIFLCSMGIFFNLLLLILLLTSKKLRFHYLYLQIVSISLADLGFIVMVDSFTVYFELKPWRLGAAFCKTWMLLDVALPSVSLLGLLLLNVDRVVFTYNTSLYSLLIQRTTSHVLIIAFPWCLSGAIVCLLWLGFPIVEPRPGFCIYGITEEANTASSWLTVFTPSLAILVLLIFVFIAVIGEMPTSSQMTPLQTNPPFVASRAAQAHTEKAEGLTHRPAERTARGSSVTSPDVQRQRRFIAALLAVDFISLAITLPYSAYSLVSPICTDAHSCDSLRTLFQTLSWMRSSATSIRPILFILLTDVYQSLRRRLAKMSVGRGFFSELSLDTSDQNGQDPHTGGRAVVITMTEINTGAPNGRKGSTTTTSVMTPPTSPFTL